MAMGGAIIDAILYTKAVIL